MELRCARGQTEVPCEWSFAREKWTLHDIPRSAQAQVRSNAGRAVKQKTSCAALVHMFRNQPASPSPLSRPVYWRWRFGALGCYSMGISRLWRLKGV